MQTTATPTAHLLLGSNLGNRHDFLVRACHQIEQQIGRIVQYSAIYETAPWGIPDQPPYLNQVVVISTALGPLDTMECIGEIERSLGRKREHKWHARTIDIDILLWGDQLIELPQLQVPHPQLPFRRFALVPLCELIGETNHPAIGRSFQHLLQICPDELPVHKWENSWQADGLG